MVVRTQAVIMGMWRRRWSQEILEQNRQNWFSDWMCLGSEVETQVTPRLLAIATRWIAVTLLRE